MDNESKAAGDNIVTLKTCDMHTAGEPVRIVTGGYPELEGSTILEKRRCAMEKHDNLRKIVINEPRGHKDMYGGILTKPTNPDAHLAVIFIQNEGYSSMCGHAVIALGRFAVDKGYVKAKSPQTEVIIECPCGIVRASVDYSNGKTRFQSVPAFVFKQDLNVKTKQFGTVCVDISYGGAYYAIFNVSQIGMDFNKTSIHDLIEGATDVVDAVKSQLTLFHPDSSDLAFLYGAILTDGRDEYETTRNLCIFADKEVDRSPTGSGVTARMALQFKRGQVKIGEEKEFQSILKTTFKGKVVRTDKCGEFDAVVVEVSGKAFYTGEHTFTVEKDDPFPTGFIL